MTSTHTLTACILQQTAPIGHRLLDNISGDSLESAKNECHMKNVLWLFNKAAFRVRLMLCRSTVTMPRKKSEKGPPPIEDLPESLRKALVRLMAKYNLDIAEAYEKLAAISDSNSRKFDEAVDKKS